MFQFIKLLNYSIFSQTVIPYTNWFKMSSDPNVRDTVVPVGGKISLDFQVQVDGLQQLYLSLKAPIYICGPGRNTGRESFNETKPQF